MRIEDELWYYRDVEHNAIFEPASNHILAEEIKAMSVNLTDVESGTETGNAPGLGAGIAPVDNAQGNTYKAQVNSTVVRTPGYSPLGGADIEADLAFRGYNPADDPVSPLFPYDLQDALAITAAPNVALSPGSEDRDALASDLSASIAQGSADNNNKEIHVHNEIPAINIEFSGSIDKDVDVEALMREMRRRLKEEMASGSDFSYAF